jgi:hypothetical protein
MVPFCALNRTTRLEQFQLAGPLLEKCQNNFLLATQNSFAEVKPSAGAGTLHQKGSWKFLFSETGLLEGWSAVVLVEYLAFVDAHDPVESDYEE